MNELVSLRIHEHDAPARLPAVQGVDAYGALLADARKDATRRAREQDLTDLGRFLGLGSPGRAAALLISGTAGQANAVALGYFRRMLDGGLSAATINRRLSSLRRLVKLARRLGLVDWTLDVDTMRSRAYRDTAGPGRDGWRKILAVAVESAAATARGKRDLAIVRLLHDNGLRRGEVAALDLADVDVEGRRLAVVGKGRTQREWLTLNGPTVAALSDWISARGDAPGPLFVRLDRASKGVHRLTADWIHELVGALGRGAGLPRPARPHGLRHAGTTCLLELTNGNVRKVQKWTRHAKAETVALYDDAREDFAGDLARLLGENS